MNMKQFLRLGRALQFCNNAMIDIFAKNKLMRCLSTQPPKMLWALDGVDDVQGLHDSQHWQLN